ncbi:MAG: hypothetical protein HON70_07770 [Lentisphaerae bacterium]|nr:hypothetical protein [Lentisphaerota bacterium]
MTSPYERVPMLHGTSSARGPVVVRGLTRHRGSDHETSFGRIVAPCNIPLAEWIRDAPDADLNGLTGRILDKKRIAVNWDKPRIDDGEEEQLMSWMKRRRLW